MNTRVLEDEIHRTQNELKTHRLNIAYHRSQMEHSKEAVTILVVHLNRLLSEKEGLSR